MADRIAEMILAVAETPELMLLAKITVVLSIGLLIVSLANSARASIRHLTLASMFALLIALPASAFLLPEARFEVPISTVSRGTVPVANRTVTAGSSVGQAAVNPSQPDLVKRTGFSLRTLIWLAWGCGVLFLNIAFLRTVWRLRGIRRSAIPWPEAQAEIVRIASASGVRRHPEVLLHELITVPLTVGTFRPAILLPCEARDWVSADLRRTFIHELEHVRRLDWMTHCFARALCNLYWFHPLVWIAWRKMCVEAERACDDAVVSQSDRADYAEQLVNLARRLIGALTPPVLSMANRSDLSRRVTAIMNTHQSRGRAGAIISCITVSCTVALAVAIAPASAVRRSVSEPTTAQEKRSASVKPSALDRALVEASAEDDLEAITKLLNAGANVNAKVEGDGSPLIVAAKEGKTTVVELLLSRGADPNLAVSGDGNPLIMAAREGHVAIVQLLLDRGADVNLVVPGDENALIQASGSGELAVVKLLVSRGADVNVRVQSAETNNEVRTALGMARRHKHDAVAEFLVSMGARE